MNIDKERKMEVDISTINYRLQSIEDEIKELKSLLVSVPILNNQFEHLEKRVCACETNIDILNAEVTKLKNEPVRKSAEKWKYITDYIFKTVVTIVVGYMLIKVGLK